MTPCCFRQRVVNSHPKEMQRHLKGLSPGSTAHHVDRAGTWLAVLRGFWRGFGCGAACLWHRGPGGREAGDTWQETGSPCWGRRRPQTPNQCSLLSLLGAGSRASGALCFLPGEGSVPSHHGRTCHYRKDGHGSIKAVTLFRS